MGVSYNYDTLPRCAYKFTGKERDAESGLDMFGARYYGSSMGRFMTPDWATKPTAVPYAHYGNPQSLNLYSYVQNNPTTVGDPDGHCSGDDCAKITVTAEKTKEPEVTSSRNGRTSTATVEGEVQYTIKNDGKPMADTQVHEDVSNKSFQDGKAVSVTPTTQDASTNKQGVIGDQSNISISTSAPSLPGTNAAEQILTTGDFSKQTTQTLTIGSTGCQVTETRTLSIKDGDVNLTLQSPKTQTATPTPPPQKQPQTH
jgi:RHS repeat-associated protein